MKDIYELLNEVKIDDDEIKNIEDIDVNDIEKAKIKKDLKNAIKKRKVSKKPFVAAACAAVIAASGVVTVIYNPAIASELPIVKNIYSYFCKNDGEAYKNKSNKINQTCISKDTEVSIRDAVFDGKSITYTYEIETKEDLGDSVVLLDGNDPALKIKGINQDGGSCTSIKRVAENKYIGVVFNDLMDDDYNKPFNINSVNVDVNISKIEGEKKSITGDWKFNFKLDAIDNKQINVNKSSEKFGIGVNVIKVSRSDLSTFIKYSESMSLELNAKINKNKENAEVHFDIKDNLGNSYDYNYGNYGYAKDEKTTYEYISLGKIDEKAEKLIITPYIKLTDDKMSKMNVPGKLVFDSVEVKVK